jgi:hypothetical protein
MLVTRLQNAGSKSSKAVAIGSKIKDCASPLLGSRMLDLTLINDETITRTGPNARPRTSARGKPSPRSSTLA